MGLPSDIETGMHHSECGGAGKGSHYAEGFGRRCVTLHRFIRYDRTPGSHIYK